jgi:uncharacterized protein YegP (UPF0339 family)
MTCQSYMNPCPCCGKTRTHMANHHGPIHLEIYKSRSANPKQRYRWRAVAANGKKVANGSEGYVKIDQAAEMARYLIPNYISISYPPGYMPKTKESPAP